MAIADVLEELQEEFDLLGDWQERYQYVIDLGNELPPFPTSDQTEVNKVQGCLSQVWLVTKRNPDGTISFRGYSDGHISRGLVAILLRLYSGETPENILSFDAKAAFARLDLPSALTVQRSNGLHSMNERIRREAASMAASAA